MLGSLLLPQVWATPTRILRFGWRCVRWRERAPLHTGTGGLSQGQRHRETRSVPRPGSNLNPGLNHSGTEPRLAARALQGSGTRGRGAAAGIRPSGSAPPLCRRLPVTGASSVQQPRPLRRSPKCAARPPAAEAGARSIGRAAHRSQRSSRSEPPRRRSGGAQVLTARQASGPSGESRSLALGGHHPRVGLGRSAGSSRLRPVRARSFPAGEKPEPFPPGT